MAVIEFDDVTKRFGDLVAVDRLTFTVERGNVVGFLGPNGAGKTTTLRMLLGLVAPSSGRATINGLVYRQLPNPMHVIGAVLESSAAYPGRTARNHLRVQAIVGDVSPARVDEVLELVGLSDAADRRVGTFSLGMRQRLGLATALLCDPDILILDEPANGLDPEGVHWLRRLLRGLAAEGRTVLVSSHILSEVAQTVDSVVILDRGRLVAQSSLAELTSAAHGVIRVRTSRAEEPARRAGGQRGQRQAHRPRPARGGRGHGRGGRDAGCRTGDPHLRNGHGGARPGGHLPPPDRRGRQYRRRYRRHQGGGPVSRLVRAELLKLRTARVNYGLLVTSAVLTVLFATLEAARAGNGPSGVAPISTAPGLTTVTTVTGFSMLLAAVLGVIVASGEFRHDTATLTYLGTPHRARVLVAKGGLTRPPVPSSAW